MTVEWNFRAQRPSKVRVKYTTEVLRSNDGTERRIAKGGIPRIQLMYSYLLDNSQARWLRAQMFNSLGDTWRVPVWHEGFPTNAVSAGAGSITGTFTDHDIQDNQRALIMSPDYETYEQVTVSSSTSSTLTLSGVTTNAYDAGSKVYPVVDSHLVSHNVKPMRVNLTRAELVFDVTSQYDMGGSGASLDTYQSKNLLHKRPLSISEKFEQGIRRMDFGLVPFQDSTFPWARIIMPRQYLITSAAERQYWEALLNSQRGGWKSLFVATYREDLQLDAQPGASATTVVVEENPLAPNFETEWFDHGGHKDLQFDTDTDGTVQRRVSSIVDNGDTLDLNLDSALPSSSGLNVDMLSFLELCVLSDTFTFTHYDTYSTVDLAVRTVAE